VKIEPKIPTIILDSIYRQYGKGGFEIIEMIKQDPSLGEPFLDNHPFVPAEIHYILKYEFVTHLIDVLCRRTEISFKISHTLQNEIALKVAEIIAETYNWSRAKKEEEIKYYLNYISKTIWF